MFQKSELLKKWRENVFFFSLIIAAGVFPFSEALVSISAGLLIFQALIFRLWFYDSEKERSVKILLFPISVFIVYLVGVLFTKDYSFALYELKKVVFWIVIPIAVFLSPKLSDKKVYIILFVFIASVTAASFIFALKLILHDYFRFESFRSISIVSHIRYSLQVVLTLILLAWFIFNNKRKLIKIPFYVTTGLFLWHLWFLLLLKSLIGIIAFTGVAGISLFLYAVKMKNIRAKLILSFLLVAMIILPVFFIGTVLKDFYNFKNVDMENIGYITPSGNKYHHDFEQSMRENGHLVFVYICDDELRQEWNKRSEIKYDDIVNGYPLSSSLIRYMTSLGYKKDSVGVSKLTTDDIEMIEDGVTNYKFKNRFFSIYPRIYETIWELDNYIQTGDPNDKTLAQRIEFVKASLILVKENPIFGIGTGNWVIEYNEVYDRMETKLSAEKRGPSHNQYLNYIVKFGVAGFIWILFAVLAPVFRLGHQKNFIFVFFLVSIAFANLGDANMETHMGLSFFTFFYSFFLWNSTGEMKKSILED